MAHTTATATWDPSHIFNLHHSSRQRQVLNPLSEARDQTHILMEPRRVRYLLSRDEFLLPLVLNHFFWVYFLGEFMMFAAFIRERFIRVFFFLTHKSD